MSADEFLSFLETHKASAILRTDVADAVAPAMEAAVRGGFRVIEFTLTTPSVYDHIAAFARRDELVVGAGTVLTPADAHNAVLAGARFLVSPVVDVDEALRGTAQHFLNTL